MSCALPLGQIPQAQGRDQAAYLAGDSQRFIAITAGRVHDVNLLDALEPEPGSFIVLDRGYLDFERLYRLHMALAFFVIRAKDNLTFRRRYSH